ncbi:MAG: SpoIID/LytB domain-containing protein [Solirubrobacteraceae bacterium]
MPSRPLRTLLATLLALSLLPAASAGAASSKFTIRGAGFGHGVGMSQYGAYGFAQHGSAYRDILAHYYTGTAIGNLDPAKRVRVLLQSTSGTAAFSGATRAGRRRLSVRKTYYVRRRGASVQLLSARRKKLGTYAVLHVTRRAGAVVLRGRAANGRVSGAYRGALDFRAGVFSGVDAVNSLPLDTYVQGVVPDESPPSWPIEALKAQAVAARTYAVATMKPAATFDLYPDTRSQVYGGVAAEEASTNQAVSETRGEVVTYNGQPVVTYFFSTSGGRTEDVENTPLGNEPRAWLKSVDDPYDDTSPRHRWGPIRMSLKQAGRRLGSAVKGSFRGIEVVRRGRSPRIVEADIIGTGGRTRVTGGQLRARFGLFDSWAFFTSITTGDEPAPEPTPEDPAAPTGGTEPFGSAALLGTGRAVGAVAGRVLPALPGARVTLQRRDNGRWITVGSTRLRRGGRYSASVASPGLYRVRYHDETGPAVRVR